MEKIFTDKFLLEIWFKRTKGEEGDQYGEAIDTRTGWMTVLQWNNEGHSCTYFGEPLTSNVSLGIGKDGGTRYAFNGYVFTQDDVRTLLNLTQ